MSGSESYPPPGGGPASRRRPAGRRRRRRPRRPGARRPATRRRTRPVRRHRSGRRACSARPTSRARCRCGRSGSVTSTTRRSASSASTRRRPSASAVLVAAVAMAIPVLVDRRADRRRLDLSARRAPATTTAELVGAGAVGGAFVLGIAAAVRRHDLRDRDDRPRHRGRRDRATALARRGLGGDPGLALAAGRPHAAHRADLDRGARPRTSARRCWWSCWPTRGCSPWSGSWSPVPAARRARCAGSGSG